MQKLEMALNLGFAHTMHGPAIITEWQSAFISNHTDDNLLQHMAIIKKTKNYLLLILLTQ